jgi:hypothetical protein
MRLVPIDEQKQDSARNAESERINHIGVHGRGLRPVAGHRYFLRFVLAREAER